MNTFSQSLKHLKIYTFIKCRFPNYLSRRTAVNLAYSAFGTDNNVPVIVLHGLLGSKTNWRSMSKNLAAKLATKVIAVDLRNHGDSPHAVPHTYTELASDVMQLMSKLKIGRANIMGHSMGGRTAMICALTESKKVHSLTVVDVSPLTMGVIGSSYLQGVLGVMKSLSFAGLDMTGAKRLTAQKLVEAGLAQPGDPSDFVTMNLKVMADKSIGWKCNVVALSNHIADITTFPPEVMGKKYSGKTFFIAGDRSDFLPESDIPGIKKMFPQATVTYVKGAGHNIHFEAAGTFLDLVTTFLRST